MEPRLNTVSRGPRPTWNGSP